MVQKAEVAEVIDVDLRRQRHHHALAAQLDSLDVGAKGQLPYAPVLMVVPDHDLVRREARIDPAADEGQDVAAKEHLDDTDAATGKLSSKGFLKRLEVVDPEAAVRARSETRAILVQRDAQDLVQGGPSKIERGHSELGGRAQHVPLQVGGAPTGTSDRAGSSRKTLEAGMALARRFFEDSKAAERRTTSPATQICSQKGLTLRKNVPAIVEPELRCWSRKALRNLHRRTARAVWCGTTCGLSRVIFLALAHR